jgi:hypothetical protein
MKKLPYLFLMGMVFNSASAFAEGRAININFGSDGRGVDSGSVQKVRDVIGQAFIAGTADTLYMYVPRKGGPIPREGEMSLCVEAGFSAKPQKFKEFFQQLHAIHPPAGTSYNVKLTDSCKTID